MYVFVGLDELRSRRNRGPVPQTKNGAGPQTKKISLGPNKLPAEIARRNRFRQPVWGGGAGRPGTPRRFSRTTLGLFRNEAPERPGWAPFPRATLEQGPFHPGCSRRAVRSKVARGKGAEPGRSGAPFRKSPNVVLENRLGNPGRPAPPPRAAPRRCPLTFPAPPHWLREPVSGGRSLQAVCLGPRLIFWFGDRAPVSSTSEFV